jgi:hypothetical protein
MKGKRGQVGVTQIIVGILALFLILVIGVAAFDWSNNGRSDFGGSLSNSMESVSGGFMSVLGPAFNLLLNLDNDVNTNFLMILTFILISIIVVGTLDSANIFGDDNKGNLVNLAVGLIVSIIGVRFMPSDIWASLTAPSTAFVATILVGAPFLALFFVTMKIKFPLARKVLWLFYLIFMSYLIFFPEAGASSSNDFAWIYIVFLLLAGIMLFLDGTVRRYVGKQMYDLEVSKEINDMSVIQRSKLRQKIADWQGIIGDDTAPADDIKKAKKQIEKLRNRYGDRDSI